jgi:hypothetical protein
VVLYELANARSAQVIEGTRGYRAFVITLGALFCRIRRNSIGNGPNLMVKAVAESERYVMPSFVRYFFFAFSTMLPAHLLVTAALWWLDR